MADFNVSTMFKAIDKVSKVFGKQGRAAILFGDKASRAFNKASRSGNKFGSVLKGVLGANIIGRGFGMIARGARNVINEFIDFDDAIVSASAKFKGLNLATKKGQATFKQLGKTARDVGATTQFTSSQAAGGLDFLALAGFNAQQAMATLPGTVDLATVANIDLARSTDIVTDALGAFNLKVDDTGQLQKNFNRLNDVMALTMARTNTNIEDMFEAIKKGAPAFTAAGQSLESFNALLGVMANSGVKGSEAGTQLRNMLSRLAAPAGAAKKILRDLNINVADSNGNFRDVVDIISDFQIKMKGMGEVAKTAALATVFGLRGITGQTILLADGADSIRKFRDELINAGGTTKMMADIIRDSLGNRLKALQSSAIELGFKFIEAFDKRGRKGIKALTAAIREFDPKPVIDFVEKAITVFESLINVLKPLAPHLSAIFKGLIAIKVAMWAVNIAMLANPVGIVLVAVGALVGLLVLLALNWDSVVASFKSGANKIGNFFADLWDVAKAKFFNFITPILKIISKLSSFFGLDTQFIDTMIEKTQQKADNARNSFLDRRNPISQKRIGELKSQGGLRLSSTRDFISPNQTEIEARQQIGFVGQININGAPSGTTVKSKTTGAPDINMNLAGAN